MLMTVPLALIIEGSVLLENAEGGEIICFCCVGNVDVMAMDYDGVGLLRLLFIKYYFLGGWGGVGEGL